MSELLPIVFRGVDEGSDPKAQPPGTLRVAENCAMDKARRIVKRDGTTGLAKTILGGGSVAAGKRIQSRGVDLGVSDGDTIYARAAALAAWQPIDRPPVLGVTMRGLVDATRSVGAIDVATDGTLLVVLYRTAGNTSIYAEVRDLATNAMVSPPHLVFLSAGNAYGAVRVLISGTRAYFFAAGVNDIEYGALDLTTLVYQPSGLLVTDSTLVATAFDVAIGTPTGGVPTLYLAYELKAGAQRLKLASFSLPPLPVLINAYLTNGTGLTGVCVAFCPLAQRIAAAFVSSTSNITAVVSADPVFSGPSLVGPTTVFAGQAGTVLVDEDSITNLLVGWARNSASNNGTDAERLTTGLYSHAANVSVASAQRITFGIAWASKPWRNAGRWYATAITFLHPYDPFSTAAMVQPSSVVVEIETVNSLTGVQNATHPHVATLANQTSWLATGQLKAAIDGAGNAYIPAAHRNREPAGYTDSVPVGWDIYTISPAPSDGGRLAVLAENALGARGAPYWYDGASAMPYGFAHAPQITLITASAGGAMAVGDYSYVAVYEWRDASGRLHRSIPSPPLTGTTAGANLTLNITVTTTSLSSKQRAAFGDGAANPVTIALYRTTVGATSAHYRLTQEPLYQVLVNDPQSKNVTIVDSKADANIGAGAPAIVLAAQDQLYTDTGELADVPPPSLTTVATHRGRIAGIGPDLRTVWFTKDSTLDATVAPGFNEALTLAFAHDKFALASLDDKLVVFGENTIDLVYGDGPDKAGTQNTWQIAAVQTDVGCINPDSIVVVPAGCVFRSRRGIELLSRKLEITWVGKVAEDTLAAFPAITSAVLVARAHEIRFTCVAEDGLTGIVLAWDYHHNIWFTRLYRDVSDTGALSVPFVDAVLVNGVYTMLTAGGQVYQETSDHKLDAGVDFVARTVELAWLSPTDKMAWHRVKDVSLLGTSVTDHDLEVSIARDYGATEQTKTFLATTDATAIGPLERCRVTLRNQKCRAVKLRIRDLAPSAPGVLGTGDGPILEGLALRVMTKDGPAKTSAAEQG